LRNYIKQMRRIKVPHPNRPGPINVDEAFGIRYDPQCCGQQFWERTWGSTGPLRRTFSTPEKLVKYYNDRLDHRKKHFARIQHIIEDLRPLSTADVTPLVFTHNDLHMENILMDNVGRLWLIDFGFSGMYPPYFEFIALRYCTLKGRGDPPLSWK